MSKYDDCVSITPTIRVAKLIEKALAVLPEERADDDQLDGDIVTPIGFVDRSRKFPTIEAGLRYIVDYLISRGHRFLMEMRGPDRISAGQFVDAATVFPTRDLGLTLHLPFSSGEEEAHHRFLACPESSLFEPFSLSGIPCYAARFGTNVAEAARVHWNIASAIYYNADSMVFDVTVYDEGPPKRRSLQAPA